MRIGWFLMADDADYVVETDFLPSEGAVYVGVSALEWMHNADRDPSDNEEGRLMRMTGFKKVFRRRSDAGNPVLTTPRMLEKIGGRVELYRIRKKGMKKLKKTYGRGIGGMENLDFDQGDMSRVKKWFGAYSSVHKTLSCGIKRYVPLNPVSSESVDRFLDLQGDMSWLNKELLHSALVAGDGVGLLSGNKNLLEIYGAGAREFELADAFICDVTKQRTVQAIAWDRSSR